VSCIEKPQVTFGALAIVKSNEVTYASLWPTNIEALSF